LAISPPYAAFDAHLIGIELDYRLQRRPHGGRFEVAGRRDDASSRPSQGSPESRSTRTSYPQSLRK
jgi:hypothetical protein